MYKALRQLGTKPMIAHGHYKLWIDNNVLLGKARGQWNLEMSLQFSDDLKRIIQGQFSGNWAHIIYLDDWKLGTPEIEPIIADLVAWAIQHGLRRAAQVYSPNMLKQYQLNRMVKEQQGPFERRIYDNEKAAFHWLSDEGYKVSRQILSHHK